RSDALLDDAYGRVVEAGIEVALLFAVEPRRALLGAVVHETLREKQRLGCLAELRAQRAGMKQAGFRAIAAFGRRVHVALLWATKNPAGKESAAVASPAFLRFV